MVLRSFTSTPHCLPLADVDGCRGVAAAGNFGVPPPPDGELRTVAALIPLLSPMLDSVFWVGSMASRLWDHVDIFYGGDEEDLVSYVRAPRTVCIFINVNTCVLCI